MAVVVIGAMLVLPLRGADVIFDWADFVSDITVVTNQRVTVKPTTTPRSEGGRIITTDTRYYTNDATGSFTSTGVVQGTYEISLRTTRFSTLFHITVPDTNATLYAINLISVNTNSPSGLSGYSITSADGLFVKRTSGWATNLTVTNLTLNPSEAVNGYVWTTDASGVGSWQVSTGSGGGGLLAESGGSISPE